MLGRKRKKAVKSTHKIIDKSNKNNHADYQEVYVTLGLILNIQQ